MTKEMIPRPLPVKARLHLAHEENASLRTRIAALEAQLAAAKDACNQSRLAFAGMVSVQSAINKLDALSPAPEAQQEPVAWVGASSLRHHVESGAAQTTAVLRREQGSLFGEADIPLYTRPAAQAVTEASSIDLLLAEARTEAEKEWLERRCATGKPPAAHWKEMGDG